MKQSLLAALAVLLILCLSLASCTGPTPPAGGDGETVPAPYKDLLRAYSALLLQKKNGEALVLSDCPLDEGIRNTLLHAAESCADPAKMGYALRDFDGNGQKELVLLSRANDLYALFTLRDGAPLLLMELGPNCTIDEGGVLCASFSNPTVTHVKHVEGDKLVGRAFGIDENADGSRSFWHEVNGERKEIDARDMAHLNDSLNGVFLSPSTTKRAGLHFIPALATQDENASPADLSTYNSILSVYRRAVALLPTYSEFDWIDGEYDAPFRFSSTEDYETYHAILYAAVRLRPKKSAYGSGFAADLENAYGYAKRDLDGDGRQELVLLTDRFEVLCIFTERNGRAVLLPDTFDARIDGAGLIYTRVNTGDPIHPGYEYSRCQISDGAMQVLDSVGCLGSMLYGNFYQTSFYKIEGGVKSDITSVEHTQLEDFYTKPNDYAKNEHIRSVAGLVYVPLNAPAAVGAERCGSHINSEVLFNSTLTLDAVSEAELTFTFHCARLASGQRTPLEGKAYRDGNAYRFDMNGVKGEIVFATEAVWLTVTESSDRNFPCRAYYFT